MAVGITLASVKAIIKSLIISDQNSCTVSELSRDFCGYEGYPIPFKQLGHNNLESLLRSIPDTVAVHGCGENARLFPVANGKSDHIGEMVKNQRKPTTKISQQRHENNSKYRNGKFKMQTNHPPVKWPSVNHESRNCTPISHMKADKIPTTSKTFSSSVIHPCDISLSFSNLKVSNDGDAAIPEYALKNLPTIDFPEGTVAYGEIIPPVEITEDLATLGSVIRIMISEVHNPYKFWFHFFDENHELEVLMDEMQFYYTNMRSNKFRIPIAYHKPGQLCAAYYSNYWHRAKIISQNTERKTKVFLIDYGTVLEVSVTDIKYLSSEYAKMSCQAIRGSLSHIIPHGVHWKYDATKYFISLIKEELLYAKVTEIDKANRIVYMVTCQMQGSKIQQINKAMIEKGYGVFDENWLEHNMGQKGQHKHHIREDFPTFEMIERSEYPSLAEMLELLKKGIHFEKIIDRKIYNYDKLGKQKDSHSVF